MPEQRPRPELSDDEVEHVRRIVRRVRYLHSNPSDTYSGRLHQDREAAALCWLLHRAGVLVEKPE